MKAEEAVDAERQRAERRRARKQRAGADQRADQQCDAGEQERRQRCEPQRQGRERSPQRDGAQRRQDCAAVRCGFACDQSLSMAGAAPPNQVREYAWRAAFSALASPFLR